MYLVNIVIIVAY